MEQNQTIRKMLHLLVNSGHSEQEALRLINESAYCQEHNIQLSDDALTKQTSVAQFLNDNKGFLSLQEKLNDLETQPEWHSACS
ncbi:MAG: hypothetical protein HKP09_06065, partial [Enterobacterales bacterium]|nr:hypothetical protein [Enterobacterales bacterium]